MVIRTPGGGGQQLGATHSQNIELYYAFVPGLKVVAPSTPADAKALLKAAIRDDDPVLFLENLALYNTKGEVPDDLPPAEIGRAAVTREGTDITIVGYSRMAAVATEVAERLAARRASPPRSSTCAACARSTATRSSSRCARPGCAVVAEDDWLTYGIGAEIAATISGGRLRLPGRARPPGRRGRGAAAVRQAPGAGRPSVGRLAADRRAGDPRRRRPPILTAPEDHRCPRSPCPASPTPWRRA